MDLVKSVNTPVAVVIQGFDRLVLLCYRRPSNCSDLYLQSDFDGLYDNISAIDTDDWEECIFKYGWSGYDTVSGIHGYTKCALYKCSFPASVITTFTSNTSNESAIRTAGLKAMKITLWLWGYSPQKGSLSNVPEASSQG